MKSKIKKNSNYATIFTIIGIFLISFIFEVLAIYRWNKCIKLCNTEKETNPYTLGLFFSYFILTWNTLLRSIKEYIGDNGMLLASFVVSVVISLIIFLIHCEILSHNEEYLKNKKKTKTKKLSSRKVKGNNLTKKSTEEIIKSKLDNNMTDEQASIISDYENLTKEDQELIKSIMKQRQQKKNK